MATKRASTIDRLMRLAQTPLRARDLAAAGISRSNLRRLVDRDVLRKVDRGLYLAVDADVTEHHSLAEVAKRVPHAVICLHSALRVHELTTESPHAVWILIGRQLHAPKVKYPKILVFRASGDALVWGVETRTIEGVEVRITTPAKTVADCFRYRTRSGEDVAIEALRDFIRKARGRGEKRGYTMDELTKAAKVDQVETVMRPYIKAML